MDSLFLIKTLGYLALFSGLLYVMFIFGKKKFLLPKTKNNLLAITSYQRVDQHLSVSIVEAAGHQFLIASNGQGLVMKKLRRETNKTPLPPVS